MYQEKKTTTKQLKLITMANFNYYYEDALAAAEAYAAENNGHIAKESATLDDRTRFNYNDIKSRNLCWSGEVAAIIVRDNDSYEDVECFAYWCAKDDEE